MAENPQTDWLALRAQFPMLREWAYFGWAATAPLSEPVAMAMRRQIDGVLYHGGARWKEWYQSYDRARAAGARLVGAHEPGEIALLKNTSEGVSTVAFGLDLKPGDNVILPRGEFPANAYAWRALERKGIEVRRVELSEHGRFGLPEIERLMDARTRVVACSFVNFATGFRADLTGIGALCRSRDVCFFVDAIQGLGVLPLDVEAMQIDALAADGHKWLCGPEGQAIFYVRKAWQERIAPLALGWWSVEQPGRYDRDDQLLCTTARRYECGTLATVAVYGCLAAVDFIAEAGVPAISARIEMLSRQLTDQLRTRGCVVHRAEGPGEWSGIVSFEVPGREARAVAAELETCKVLVNPRGGRLRAAIHAWNDETDLERLVAALPAS